MKSKHSDFNEDSSELLPSPRPKSCCHHRNVNWKVHVFIFHMISDKIVLLKLHICQVMPFCGILDSRQIKKKKIFLTTVHLDMTAWLLLFHSFVQPLDLALSGHAAAIINGEIFISGGFNCKYECLVSTCLYHPERGTIYLADMTYDRAQHCMEALQSHLYVAGGVCNLRKFYTDQLVCEVYDTVADCWTTFASLPMPHVGAASIVMEEKIYVLGGYCQDDYSESALVHRFDPIMQRWETMGKLPGAVTDIRACLMHLPQHLRQ